MDPKRQALNGGESNGRNGRVSPVKLKNGGFERVRDVRLDRIRDVIMRLYFAESPSNVVGDDKVLSSAAAYIVDLRHCSLVCVLVEEGN